MRNVRLLGVLTLGTSFVLLLFLLISFLSYLFTELAVRILSVQNKTC